MNERSSKFAVWMTILWLGGIFSFYILGLFERPISFNELGDFLAGVFAPVAFLWLIYGYFQNSEALQAQIKEMNAGVKQQTELAAIQKQQFRAMLNAATGIVKIVNCKLSIDPVCLQLKDGLYESGNVNDVTRIIAHEQGKLSLLL